MIQNINHNLKKKLWLGVQLILWTFKSNQNEPKKKWRVKNGKNKYFKSRTDTPKRINLQVKDNNMTR